jgi:hypothetical protein
LRDGDGEEGDECILRRGEVREGCGLEGEVRNWYCKRGLEGRTGNGLFWDGMERDGAESAGLYLLRRN